MHLRRVGWLPHCLPTHRRRIRELCLPSQENRGKDPVIGRVFVSILLRGKAEFPYAAAVRGKTMR